MNKCLECKNEIVRHGTDTIERFKKRKWCSRKCYIKYIKTNPSPLRGCKHSKEHIRKQRKAMLGKFSKEKHWAWKGGKSVSGQYKTVLIDGKYILEHRVVMERFIGRKLKRSEIVHHIDHDKKNNSLSNLTILTRPDHAREHIKSNPIYGYWKGKKLSKERKERISHFLRLRHLRKRLAQASTMKRAHRSS